ncbi:hypothetical protein TSAR_014874 [Trichomalopsis sarcophagae]|uniref:Uncharacterized protein n=1 Tax=Trichomalopsis sarcophagae TaxID=543379 RepID=A0A232EVU5_9HYME|nr:hypothetical protein TSAR_014874 [Trichomalopsis sarcophagae]
MKLNTNQTMQHLFYFTLFTLMYTCSAFNDGQQSVTRSFSKNYTMPSETGVTASNLLLSALDNETVNDAFHYAICKQLDSEFACNITLETWPFAHGTFRSHCADFKINLPENNNSALYLTTIRSGSNKILLKAFTIFGEDGNRLKYEFTLIDMSKCTSIQHFIMDTKMVDRESPKLVNVHKNAVEVGYANEKQCDGKPSCKITYDYEGNKIGETEPFNLKYLQFDSSSKAVLPVNYQKPGKGYYIIERDFAHSLYAVSYVDSSGEGKRQISNWIPDNIRYSAISCAHELYTHCHKNENEDRMVHCAQYDTEKLRMNITIEMLNTVVWLAVRDLSGGGFVLATGSCTSTDKDTMEDLYSCKEFRIQRFSEDGQRYKALDIDELEFLIQHSPRQLQVMISENDNDEFCIFLASRNRLKDNNNGYYSFNKWCVSRKYTSVRD